MKPLPETYGGDVIFRKILKFLERQAEKAELQCRKELLSFLEENHEAELLDLGCGDGSLTLEVAIKIGTKKVYGIDLVEENVKKCKERDIKAHQGDLNGRFPFKDESFDVIVASHIFEHLSDTDTFLKEIRRTLKDKGYCVIATPNLAALHHIFLLILGKQPTIAEISDEALVGTWSPRGKSVGRVGPAHRRVPTLSALKELLEYHGFEVERMRGTDFFPLPNPLAKIMSHIDKRHATNIIFKARKR